MDCKTSPKPFAFVLMPFSDDFDDVYHLGIKPACVTAGAYAERVDEQIYHESMLARIYNQIAKADIIIADMTGRNPNVFYETGYAHALGKPVILLTSEVKDIPFDLKHYPHIIYGGKIKNMIPELVKRVRFAIERPFEAAKEDAIEVYVEGKSLRSNADLVYRMDKEGILNFEIDFAFHNPVNTRLQKAIFQIGIVAGKWIKGISIDQFGGFNSCLQPDGETSIYLLSNFFELFPASWESLSVIFHSDKIGVFAIGEILQATLRVLTDVGPIDFPFTVSFVEGESMCHIRRNTTRI